MSRQPWSEHGDEATPRTAKDDERARSLAEVAYRALLTGHDISRPRPGDGRCAAHAIRGCRCGGER
jgi:hypothetical protein